jgi:hypothetical protein
MRFTQAQGTLALSEAPLSVIGHYAVLLEEAGTDHSGL